MKINPLPTVEELNELLHYDADTGAFTWKKFRGNTAKAGVSAGAFGSGGYILLCVNGKRYLAHRVAWKMAYGIDPINLIDHIDGDTANNRLSNLRIASQKQNQGNSKTPKHNSSGLKGVSWNKKSQKWCAQIKNGKKKIWLGVYENKIDAHEAYMIAAKEMFGEFANNGEGL